MAGEFLHIEGSVENVVYKNSTNGYTVLDLDAGGELIPVIGNLGDVEEGEILILEGNYEATRKYGTQFRAEYCERKLPENAVNIEKYLASGAIKGIGPGLAKKIVNIFGAETLNVIENNPYRLSEIKGISRKKCDEIAEEAKKLFSLRSVTTFLSQFNIKPKYAMSAFRRYGGNSMEMIKLNPYILCSEGIDVEFGRADSVAMELDIPRNSHKRIIAGMHYILRAFSERGHTCMLVEHLLKVAADRLNISEKEFYAAYNAAMEDNELFCYIIDDKEYVYLPDFYYAEQFIADRINVIRDFIAPEDFNYDTLIDIEESEKKIKYEEKQRLAITTAVSRGLMVLTGGPGTGKTTTLNAIISIFEKRGDKVYLAAPTGRAAKRMSELTNREAKTIHRLLEVVYDSTGRSIFAHNEKNPLECDVIIIDEMSMVDCVLFEKLLRALQLGCRLIMVGDFHQLPSVGAGNLLKDIISSGAVPVVQLTEIFRQAQQSSIVTNAHKIVSGTYPDLTRKDSDFFFFKRNDFGNVVDLIVDLTKRRLPNAYKYSPMDDIQIISPSRIGTVGTVELNKILQEKLNPPSKDKAEYRGYLYTYRVGDKVMQTRNNYDIVWKKDKELGTGVFNGDIGKIESISTGSKTVQINFDGRTATYTFDLLPQVELAYAITVHKSQGCEFEAVIMPVMDVFKKLSYRNLLYTAVTRAKKLLILIGDEQVVNKMVDNNKRAGRHTCLKYMLSDRKE
ncbi:MAG: ATP-dependent RecD-like DNA helicase [Ruminococcus sp.]|nr:ATP-dependent RecD-like DNA helicase [Ruminococcus sp.]